MSNGPILVSLWKSPLHFIPSSLPPDETVKDIDRELIQQHVWCIFKQPWRIFFSPSFQPTEDLICYNLISGQNHTAYLSNIKHPQFSLAGHLAGEWGRRKKRILFYFLRIFTHLHFFIWHLKEALICQVITSSFLKREDVQVQLEKLCLFWHTDWRAVEGLVQTWRSGSRFYTLHPLHLWLQYLTYTVFLHVSEGYLERLSYLAHHSFCSIT